MAISQLLRPVWPTYLIKYILILPFMDVYRLNDTHDLNWTLFDSEGWNIKYGVQDVRQLSS